MDNIKDSDDSPWTRLDPAQVQREAELKEQRIIQKTASADAPAPARRERRPDKATAKAARKSNVKQATKWIEERKAADKPKKLASRPHEQEKRRERLLRRATKLEEQAEMLLVEAQKARAQYAYLSELKEEEDAGKDKLLHEVRQTASKETDDSIPSNVDDALPGPAENGMTRREAGEGQDGEEPGRKSEVVGNSDAALGDAKRKIEKKKRRKEEAVVETKQRNQEDSGAGKKKDKKKRKHPAEIDAVDAEVGEVGEMEHKKARKGEKRKREEAAPEDATMEGGTATTDRPTPKKSKKNKEEKSGKETAGNKHEKETPSEKGQEADTSEQWNVSGLDGGPTRQEKFLRLLGAKKHGGGLANLKATSRDRVDMKQVASDLERQFDTGMRMKLDCHGQRRGLGT